jgi:Xaa-Pro aminopeptidase
VRQCDRQLALSKRLPAFLKGNENPTSAAELLEFALLCRRPDQARYAGSARLSAKAFGIEPKLADDLKSSNRYNAACAAALAGCDRGRDAVQLDRDEKARLRGQALDWLRADLALLDKLAHNGRSQDATLTIRTLRHWQSDTDLAGVRDAAALAKLQEEERRAWWKLWSDVERLVKEGGTSAKAGR